jgi:hypothetical protein
MSAGKFVVALSHVELQALDDLRVDGEGADGGGEGGVGGEVAATAGNLGPRVMGGGVSGGEERV